jgi:drug/metabolite transporter (DMT)-like permease
MTESTTRESEAEAPAHSDLLGSLAVLFAAACWGLSGVFVKLVSAEVEISALALAFWRDITTFVVLLVGIGVFRPAWLRIRRRDLRWLIGLGASLGIFHVFWNLAVFLSGAAVATVQQAAMPAIVAVAAWLLWRERLTWSKVAAIFLTFVGTVLVSGLGVVIRQGAGLSLGGLLVGLAVPVTYASWNLFGKKVRETYNPFTTLTYAFGFGALVLLPLQFFTPQPWPVPSSALLWFAGLIAVATIIPFSVYTFALGRLPASVATILAMSEIAFVAAYAYVLLGERLTASQILGGVLVVGGVLLLSWHRWRERAQKK